MRPEYTRGSRGGGRGQFLLNAELATEGLPYRPVVTMRQGRSNPRRKSQERTSVGHFVGTRAFNSSTQFSTTTIPVGVDVGSPPAALIIKNVWPSRETS